MMDLPSYSGRFLDSFSKGLQLLQEPQIWAMFRSEDCQPIEAQNDCRTLTLTWHPGSSGSKSASMPTSNPSISTEEMTSRC